MQQTQCPICFTPLEIRNVRPSFVCGGWPNVPEKPIRHWRMPNGEKLVLCSACELEEFMIPRGWGYRLGLDEFKLPINCLQSIPNDEAEDAEVDKFCPTCNLRLAFLKVIANSRS
jgi:hypothetical protein